MHHSFVNRYISSIAFSVWVLCCISNRVIEVLKLNFVVLIFNLSDYYCMDSDIAITMIM